MIAVGLRVVCMALAFAMVLAPFQGDLARLALPCFNGWLHLADKTFRTESLDVQEIHGEPHFVREASPAVAQVVGSHVIAADPQTRIITRIAAGILVQPFVILVAVLLAWPARYWRQRLARVALAMPLCAVIALLDIPLALYAFAWNEILKALNPSGFSPLVQWADFMNSGGRLGLSLAGAVLVILLTQRRDPVRPGARA